MMQRVGGGAETPAIAVQVDSITIGLAVKEGTGYRFVAADPRFQLLDGSRFGRLAQLEKSAGNLHRALAPRRRLHAA